MDFCRLTQWVKLRSSLLGIDGGAAPAYFCQKDERVTEVKQLIIYFGLAVLAACLGCSTERTGDLSTDAGEGSADSDNPTEMGPPRSDDFGALHIDTTADLSVIHGRYEPNNGRVVSFEVAVDGAGASARIWQEGTPPIDSTVIK